ncbi:microsomal glutathione S-transferase 3-like isoform X1 [Mytilus californianus]|uniref:microsomal glutathione S-transferase 3-like isoform X1 n=1 Tax=Mytilus californianus TaxID=6549 RepID=UPI002245C3B9|nr:microsomal glutathione S-transferase 3-like isoform X1 [Mytilus californianus]
MAVTFTLPSDFGYVILTSIASIFVLMWKGFQVGKARTKYEVPYPKMYSDDDRFNCVQRAHQNTLENYPQFLILLIFGGLTFPKLSAAAGMVWIVGRVFYALGYYSGDPKKRMRGAFAYIGLLALLVFSIITALKMLGFVNFV